MITSVTLKNNVSWWLGHTKRRNQQKAWRGRTERKRGVVHSKKRIVYRKESKAGRAETFTKKSWYGWAGNEDDFLYESSNRVTA